MNNITVHIFNLTPRKNRIQRFLRVCVLLRIGVPNRKPTSSDICREFQSDRCLILTDRRGQEDGSVTCHWICAASSLMYKSHHIHDRIRV